MNPPRETCFTLFWGILPANFWFLSGYTFNIFFYFRQSSYLIYHSTDNGASWRIRPATFGRTSCAASNPTIRFTPRPKLVPPEASWARKSSP